MTIEAQATLVAGWYDDPAQSGGDRWWDGARWTEHLRLPAPSVPAPSMAPAANPGLTRGVISAPTAPNYDERAAAEQMRPGPAVSNGAAILALLFGAIALVLAITNIVPGTRFIVAGATVIALIWGVRGLVRHRSGAATILWAPIVGILLGIVATASVFVGGDITSLVSSVVPQPTAVSSPSASSAAAPRTSAEPLVFPTNANLTAEEAAAQTVATAVNRMFASGNATLPPGSSWPASIQVSGSSVLAPGGTAIATLPTGMTASYLLSPDKTSYRLSITGADATEVASYSSGLNGFSWSCATTDPTCVPSN